MPPEHSTQTDETLARQALAGEMSAFEELVRRHEARVYGFLVRCLGSEADARDATQETFVAAYRRLGQFDTRQSFACWLFGIARRKWIDLLRARRDTVQPESVEMVDTANPASDLTQEEDRAELWTQARRLLPELQFQALWLRYAEEMPVREIARVLRRTPTHVKVLLFRARTTLADALTPQQTEAAAPAAPMPPPPGRLPRPLPAASCPAFDPPRAH